MGSCLSTATNPSTRESTRSGDQPATNAAVHTSVPSSHAPSSSSAQYTVFISHADEDKATIALPLRQKLLEHGVTAFVDEVDNEPGTEADPAITEAMETADVAVIVLSPEYVARKWPMKQLMRFLRRREESIANGGLAPVVIPFFYRLNIAELYDEPRLDRKDKDGNLLYHKSRFYEREERGEPEADIARIKEALASVHQIMGLRNDLDASNEPSYLMSERRGILLRELCDRVREAVPAKTVDKTENRRTGRADRGAFQVHFDVPYETYELVFDFYSEDKNGEASTQEGKLLRMLLDRSRIASRSIGVRGISGVGKTSLLRGVRILASVRERFRDGIYNMELGMHATRDVLIEALSLAVQRSGGNETANAMRIETNIRRVTDKFRSWFAKKHCLFLIDDVWETKVVTSEIIHELLNLHESGRDSKVLLTTRSTEISSRADAHFSLEPRSVLGDESRSILFRYSRIKPEPDRDDDRRVVNEILERCSGLPVFLAVAGRAVKVLSLRIGHEGCEAYHRYAENLKSRTESLLTTDVGPYERLSVRLMISVEMLEKRKKEFRFRVNLTIPEMLGRLSVFTRQVLVPMTALMHLWELSSPAQASEVAREFEQVGLAGIAFERRERGVVEVLRLHDSIYEFCVVEARRHGEEKVGHEALLRGYSRGLTMRDGCHEWWHSSIEADTYIHANLCRHLLGAGRTTEAVYLLLLPQWAKRQVRKNSIQVLEADFSLVIAVVGNGIIGINDDEAYELTEALRLISEAVTLSSKFISSNTIELSFQLHGRIKDYCESNRMIQKYVSWIETDAERPFILSKTSVLGESGSANTTIIPVGSPLSCMTMLKDKETLACGCWDGGIALVNLRKVIVENKWKAHDDEVTAVAITSGETRLISVSRDITAKVWDFQSGYLVTSFNSIFIYHSDWVSDVAIMRDGRRAISASNDGTAQIWNWKTGEFLKRLSRPDTADDDRIIQCVTALREEEEEVVVTGGDDNKLRIWNVSTGAQISGTFDGHDKSVRCVAVSPDEQYLVSGSLDNTVRVWDIRSRQQLGSALEGHTSYVSCVAVSEDGRRIVSGSLDSTIRVWDAESQCQLGEPLVGHTAKVTGVSFLGDSNDLIVSCSWDGTVRLWDKMRKSKKRLTNHHEGFVSAVSFSPNGKFAVSGSFDKTIRIWDITSGQQVGDPLQGHSNFVNDVTVTPNGRFVVFVSGDKTVRVWNLNSHRLLHTFTGHTHWIRCVAVTPRGDRVATGSDDRTVRLWDLENMNSNYVELNGHGEAVERVFVSDDGLRIVSVDRINNIFVWDLNRKELVKQFKKENAWRLSRREVLNIVGEMTVHDDTTLSIPLRGREIFYGEEPSNTVLATLEDFVYSWALSSDKKTICVGLREGKVVFLRLER